MIFKMLKVTRSKWVDNVLKGSRAFTCFVKSSGRSTISTRAFRRRLNASADVLADTLKFGCHCRAGRKEDGSRSLGRSSDIVHYGAGNGREIEKSKRVERARGVCKRRTENRASRYTGERDSWLWSDQNWPLFVTSSYLAGHFRTRDYVHTTSHIRPTDIFNARNFHRACIYIAGMSDLPTRLRSRKMLAR